MPSRRKVSLLAFGIVSLGSIGTWAPLVPAQGQPAGSASACRPADSSAVVGVANRFHQILSTGDTTGINALLAPDLRVLEGGTVESRQEYFSHHLSADIEFAKAVKGERAPFSYSCDGNIAWLISTSTSTGKFKGRDINSAGAELLILSRTEKGWQIRAIHWSSARRQPR
ncbi:MAG: nuclear transport factor 2 family protein [Anaerolineae bacterium]|nr:nuclear transport factor 2 family protein [Gemmatimonadaceae bacterium]